MWGLVRQYMKMGMLRLAKHMPKKIEPGGALPDHTQPKPTTNDRASHPTPQATPRATGFAARREKLMGDAASK